MKKFILLSTSFVTLIGVYFTFVILFMFGSNYYFSKAFESMFWVLPIILPLLIIIFIVDSRYCNKNSKNWLLKETFFVMLVIMLFALSKYSFQLLYTFGSMFLLTQIIKYLIFTRYCKIQEKN